MLSSSSHIFDLLFAFLNAADAFRDSQLQDLFSECQQLIYSLLFYALGKNNFRL